MAEFWLEVKGVVKPEQAAALRAFLRERATEIEQAGLDDGYNCPYHLLGTKEDPKTGEVILGMTEDKQGWLENEPLIEQLAKEFIPFLKWGLFEVEYEEDHSRVAFAVRDGVVMRPSAAWLVQDEAGSVIDVFPIHW